MKNVINKILFILFFTIIIGLEVSQDAKADTQTPENISVSVDNAEAVIAHGLYVSYDNNLFISLVDMQNLLKGTAKEFDFKIEDGAIYIYTAEYIEEMTIRDRELAGWSEGELAEFENKSTAMNIIYFNEDERRYPTILTTLGGYKEIFIHITDFCLLFNIDANRDGLSISINTNENMKAVNPVEMENNGLFQGVNSIFVGDATTGEVFYAYNPDEAYPIASTTKLMTYLLMEEAVQSGRISYDDQVTFSKVAEDLSKTSDGLIPMKEGQSAPLRELIYAALIISSNECDHMVSEHFGGDEENIVAMMNDKATQLSMTTAQFYNCNGLPSYTDNLVPAKRQNRMSSRDMFTMCSYILNNYPQVKEITSTKYTNLETLNKDLKNTNALLFNMPEVNGLKTGTTNRSGACLVASLTVNDGSVDHDLVVVEFGAETSADRIRISELMARYAKAVVQGEASKYEVNTTISEEDNLSANGLVNMLVNQIMRLDTALSE